MGDIPLKLIADYPIGTLRNATTVANKNVVALALKSMPGVGQPFYIFNSLPGTVVAADFDMFPFIVSSVVSENLQMINDMLDMEDDNPNPLHAALTFAP